MMSGALADIATASGLDIYFPSLVILISISAGVILKPCAVFWRNEALMTQ